VPARSGGGALAIPDRSMGTGRAFVCKAADCGTEVNLYLRCQLGSCNCATGVPMTADLGSHERLDLVGGKVSSLGAGRPITIA